jgi:hypothetical protein
VTSITTGTRVNARQWGLVAAAAVVLAGAALWVVLPVTAPFAHRGRPIGAPPAGAAPAPPAGPRLPGKSASTPSTPPTPHTGRFASVRGLQLYLPASHPVLIGYHEASYGVALALSPSGRCVRDYNRTKFRKPPPGPGPHYFVMSSRGRGRSATSAADIAMHKGTIIRSPVTGVVVGAKPYRLYGRYPDDRIVIRPDAVRGIQVVVIHAQRVRVQRGERVFAGVTPIGVPRVFPFRSQVNDYIGPGIPHVHIEVNKIGASRHQAKD